MKNSILALALGASVILTYAGCGGDTDSSENDNTAGTSSSAGSNSGGSDAGGASSGGTDAGGSSSGGTEAGGTEAGGTDAGGASAGGTDAGGAGGTETDPFAGPTVCTSNKKWTLGDQESPNMHPGGTCITCHKQKAAFKSSIQFSVAGTVFPTGHEPVDCNGVNASTTKGIEVVITDAAGVETVIPVTLASGNFYKKFAMKTPYKAKVRYNGKERVMGTEQTNGDCNSCHTEAGAEGAPGRIVLPLALPIKSTGFAPFEGGGSLSLLPSPSSVDIAAGGPLDGGRYPRDSEEPHTRCASDRRERWRVAFERSERWRLRGSVFVRKNTRKGRRFWLSMGPRWI